MLPVAQGGTGKTTHTSNAVLTGNGTSAVKNVATVNGALYATAANGAPKFGTLPVAQGGTGATTAIAARANLGLNASNLKCMFNNGVIPANLHGYGTYIWHSNSGYFSLGRRYDTAGNAGEWAATSLYTYAVNKTVQGVLFLLS